VLHGVHRWYRECLGPAHLRSRGWTDHGRACLPLPWLLSGPQSPLPRARDPARCAVATSSFESTGQLLASRRRPAKIEYDEDRAVILAYITDFAAAFNDQARLTTSTSRAVNLYHQSEWSRGPLSKRSPRRAPLPRSVVPVDALVACAMVPATDRTNARWPISLPAARTGSDCGRTPLR
jgi:hypothetical protein